MYIEESLSQLHRDQKRREKREIVNIISEQYLLRSPFSFQALPDDAMERMEGCIVGEFDMTRN